MDADGARVRALAVYKDFLTLWKDTDLDIPILKKAKVPFSEMENFSFQSIDCTSD